MDLENEEQSPSIWQSLSDDIIIRVFSFLPATSLLKVARVCKTFHRLAFDEILWKDLFYRHWKVDRSKPMSPGKVSWMQEYKRLYYHTPAVESEVVQSHTDEVLYVSFSHNGKMFATSSKDGFIKVWDKNSYPCSLKNQADMKRFKWKFTAFSEFNKSDTLLLVSGSLSGSGHIHGEIAVFCLQGEFEMLSQVTNTPFYVFGTWYNDCCFLSGNSNVTGHGVSYSDIWLNKVTQKTEFKQEPMVRHLFCFRNNNYNFVRRLMIASVFRDSSQTLDIALTRIRQTTASHPNQLESKQSISTSVMLDENRKAITDAREESDKVSYICKENSDQEVTLNLKSVTSEVVEQLASLCVADDLDFKTRQLDYSNNRQISTIYSMDQSSKSKNGVDQVEINVDFRVDRTCQDTVNISSLHSSVAIHGSTIFSVNSQPLSLHNVNSPDLSDSFKVPRESNGYAVFATPDISDTFDKHLDQPHSFPADDQDRGDCSETEPISVKLSANNEMSVKSRHSSNNLPDKYLIFTFGSQTWAPTHIGIKLFQDQDYFDETTGHLLPDVPDMCHSPDGDSFDSIDHLFDMHGIILDTCLSPDHRYLYVNSRRWQDGYQIDDPIKIPPVGEEIDLHVFDLLQFKVVGKMDASHKAYTPSNNWFSIFLDSCENYVASGAEDKHAHMWDSHYGICLNKFPHSAVVNSVAFNPADPEMLVTVSDDISIKLWRSRNSENNLIKSNMQNSAKSRRQACKKIL